MKRRWDSNTTAALALVLCGAVLPAVSPGYPHGNGRARDSLLACAAAAFSRGEWGDGADIAEALVADSSGDLDARYYAAICRRELGKRTSLILREIQWDRARKHFARILESDSSFRDILYQQAVFLEYDDDLEGAVESARRQILRRPEQAESLVGLLRIGRHYISATDGEEALEWLRGRGDVYSQFFLAELLRRERQFKQAETRLLHIQELPDLPPQATCIALARLYACIGRDGDGLAQASYWNGVENAASPEGEALIFEDIKPVINDDELIQYRSLRTQGEKVRFFHAFWESRDPAPASPINRRLIEHFLRYAKAEREYEYLGVRTRSANPDPTLLGRLPQSFFLNHEFNDMGLIYLRHGPPDAYQVTSSSGDDNVSWLYNASGESPPRIFIFARHLRVAADWRLTSVPTDPAMKSKVALWDYRYSVDQQRWPQVGADLEAEQASAVSAALRSEHYTWEEETRVVSVPHRVDAFRAPQGRTLLDISYGVTMEDFADGSADEARTVPIEVGISFIAPGGGKTLRELDTVRVPLRGEHGGSYIGLIRRTLVPDSVRVAMHVRALEKSVIGTWSETMRVPAFGTGAFSLSDMQFLLPSTARASIEIDGVRIVQSPFRAYRRSARLYAYLQIYNLVKDADGKAKYTAHYELLPGDPPGPEDAIVLGETTRELTEDTRAEFTAIDLSAVPPGTYTLRVTVTDRKRVETLTRERPIQVLP